jgi:hypothetical protein
VKIEAPYSTETSVDIQRTTRRWIGARISQSVKRLAVGWISSPGGVKNYLFSMSSRPALGPTEPPVQRIPGVLSAGEKLLGCEAGY